MAVKEQIQQYITSQAEPKRSDMQALHRTIVEVKPACELWFLDGKNSEGKIVSNPNIGYGSHTLKYADGTKYSVSDLNPEFCERWGENVVSNCGQ